MRTKFPYTTWSERRIQQALAEWCLDKGHSPVVPNCGVFGWEADVLSVTPTGFCHEFEIKISIEDFRADADKTRKHNWMKNPRPPKYAKSGTGLIGPVYFWYAVPRDLVEKVRVELPEYAGLIEVYPERRNRFDVVGIVKQAPRIHVTKVRENDLYYMYRGVSIRFWKLRGVRK